MLNDSQIMKNDLIFHVEMKVQMLILKFDYLKSMKFLAFLTLASIPSLSLSASLTIGCPQGQISISSTCIEPPVPLQACSQYQTPTKCSSCAIGYNLQNDICSPIAGQNHKTYPAGCLKVDQNGDCVNCANGFMRKNGECLLGVKDCSQYQEDGKCEKCKKQYSLVLDVCRHNFLLGCRNESSSHTCTECYTPFKLTNSYCQIQDCKSYNDYGCIACECGFYLTPELSCKKVVEGCIRYERGLCIDCVQHHRLKGGVCQIEGCLTYINGRCQSCSNDYDKTDEGNCEFKNCYDWDNGVCLICKEGFRRDNGVCVKAETVCLD